MHPLLDDDRCLSYLRTRLLSRDSNVFKQLVLARGWHHHRDHYSLTINLVCFPLFSPCVTQHSSTLALGRTALCTRPIFLAFRSPSFSIHHSLYLLISLLSRTTIPSRSRNLSYSTDPYPRRRVADGCTKQDGQPEPPPSRTCAWHFCHAFLWHSPSQICCRIRYDSGFSELCRILQQMGGLTGRPESEKQITAFLFWWVISEDISLVESEDDERPSSWWVFFQL